MAKHQASNFYLSGSFAPIKDEHDLVAIAPAAVKGEIPRCLQNGQFVRVGSNPRFVDSDRPYHWFDGDGMVHSLLFKAWAPHYVNKYIESKKYRVKSALFDQSSESGFNVNVSLATLGSGGRLDMTKAVSHLKFLRYLTGIDFLSTANTALTFFNGRLLSLMEGSTPVYIHSPTLQAVGNYHFEGQLSDKAREVTAHPKISSETGEMTLFGYKLDAHPTYTILWSPPTERC
ncbi:carotenoid oxygenase [Powellomyces hirtus]|nr:carotenoid oxygenase [Powellomyces hirtus]